MKKLGYVHFLLTECNVKTGDISFEGVEHFKYLGITLKNKNYIHKKIKNRLNPKNTCHHLVQNLLPFGLLFKNIKIKIYRTTHIACSFIWV
jgi:hypothetical protein